MSTFIKEARDADNKPDLGDTAIYAGVVGVVTADNPANQMQSFFDLVGVNMDEYSESETSKAERIDDTLEDAASYF
tara:strand:- start:561 stop:788 length:228 start_codon:yes stop_codon:yes gene_type:complete